MTDRSAVDTLRGYFYQFDWTILSALQLANDDDSIEVECIEDVDIRTATDLTAIQCKYYAGTDYNHSVIKPAVMHMLSHFKEVASGAKPKAVYVIRGHYASGQHKLNAPPDVAFLKAHLLTYTKERVEHRHHDELGLTDQDLSDFLSLLTININAASFEAQYSDVIARLQAAFNCSPFAAEFHHYNSALATIRDLAIKPAASDRVIKKAAFLSRINNSNILFHEWFVQKKGRKAHLAALRTELFSALNVSPFERFFLFEVDPARYVRVELKELLYTVAKKWSKLSKRDPKPFCPYVFVNGIAHDELLALKNEMATEGFKFLDGHDYLGAQFSAASIARAATHDNGIKLKVLNSIHDLVATVNAVTKTRKVYQFHLGQTYFDLADPAVGHVKIQVAGLADLKAIV